MQGYYSKNGGLQGLGNLGRLGDATSIQPATTQGNPAQAPEWLKYTWRAASIGGTAIGAYHGYKRNNGSIGWAIGWALLGGIFPIITVPIAFAQGIGDPKGR
jgi:hypothetical protein